MTQKTPVKLISLQQEHLPQILKLTVFSINQLPAKHEHAEINLCFQRMRLVPPIQPLAVLCLMHQQGFFSRLQHGCVNMYFAQFSWETSPEVLTVQPAKT